MWTLQQLKSTQQYSLKIKTLFGKAVNPTIVFLHGWGDHGARYKQIGELLHREGYNIVMPDFPGHGLSEGPRARVNCFDTLKLDLKKIISFFSVSDTHSSPLILCGHSMGGTLAFHYALEYPEQIDSVIFNSAALSINSSISQWKKTLSSTIARYFPSIKIARIKFDWMMTSLDGEMQAYKNDPLLYHGRMEAGTGKALMEANDWVVGNMSEFNCAFLALQGMQDQLVDPLGPSMLMERSPAKHKAVLKYNDRRHDLLHDIHSDEVAIDITEWLEKRYGVYI